MGIYAPCKDCKERAVGCHGDVSLFVPPYVEQKLDEKLDSKENEHEQN